MQLAGLLGPGHTPRVQRVIRGKCGMVAGGEGCPPSPLRPLSVRQIPAGWAHARVLSLG